jgi:MarR-like DNA-binding transcriptional regulator SgrR of sgrS sRNA
MAIILFLVAVSLQTSCTSTRPKVEGHSNSQVVTLTDEKLTDAAIQFLAVPHDADPDSIEKHRRQFYDALSTHLSSQNPATSVLLRVHRDDMTFMLPITFVDRGSIFPKGSSLDWTTERPQELGTKFNGEILDLAWIASGRKSAPQIAALFSDSLLVFDWPHNKGTKRIAFHFNDDALRPIRANHPAGLLDVLDLDDDDKPEIIAVTSNLNATWVGEYDSEKIKSSGTIDFRNDSAWPTSLKTRPGQSLFFGSIDTTTLFRSERRLPGSGVTMSLDESGHLSLFDHDSARVVWTSQQPWGNRLFVLGPKEVAVSDGQQPTFVSFGVEGRQVQLIGQSPAFDGSVSAIIPVPGGDQRGILVSAVTREVDGTPVSRLYFIPRINYSVDMSIDYDRPRFPDYRADLTFVSDKPESEYQSSMYYDLPDIVWRNCFETLFRITEEGRRVPNLVSHYESDSTGTVWKFHLKKGIRFADGSEMTAEDVRQSWERNWQLDHQNKCSSSWLWKSVAGASEFVSKQSSSIEGLKAKGVDMIEVTLNEPRPYFVEHLTQPCFGVTKPTENHGHGLGTGPFAITDIKPGREFVSFTCQRNAYFHDGQPPIRSIRFAFRNLNIVEALSGERLAATITNEKTEIEFFQQLNTLALYDLSVKPIYFLAVNPLVEPLSNASLRRYLVTRVLSRREIANIVSEAEVIEAPTFFAKEEVAIATSSKESIPSRMRALTVAFRSRDSVARQIAERLHARCDQLGIPSESPNPLSDKNFESLRQSGKYDILIDSFTPIFSMSTYNLGQLLMTGYAMNSPIEADVNQLLEQRALWSMAGIERRLIEDAILYPIVRMKNYAVLPAQLQDVRLLGSHQLDFSNAWITR